MQSQIAGLLCRLFCLYKIGIRLRKDGEGMTFLLSLILLCGVEESFQRRSIITYGMRFCGCRQGDPGCHSVLAYHCEIFVRHSFLTSTSPEGWTTSVDLVHLLHKFCLHEVLELPPNSRGRKPRSRVWTFGSKRTTTTIVTRAVRSR
ncbi:hypothetical protein BJX68DRAFT_129522 [Aspergillus pseudodeflectus]|uniref:Secreted protein n=1 Tax=Aspergillus pseudodeflectus TaxID=176178 RepID=A0ABR4K160_9EURO